MKNSHDYDDIINLPHHVSKTHKQMSAHDRAAQFGAFKALTGYEDAVNETARLTDSKPALSESMIEMLNMKLQIILDNLEDKPEVTITYFVPDKKKSGGAYVTHTGCVRRIDDFEQKIIMTDKTEIQIKMIAEIESDLFNDIENG